MPLENAWIRSAPVACPATLQSPQLCDCKSCDKRAKGSRKEYHKNARQSHTGRRPSLEDPGMVRRGIPLGAQVDGDWTLSLARRDTNGPPSRHSSCTNFAALESFPMEKKIQKVSKTNERATEPIRAFSSTTFLFVGMGGMPPSVIINVVRAHTTLLFRE